VSDDSFNEAVPAVTNRNRLILYHPVSALVTLFGNILQNPLDPRAKSDTRLMNVVVTFLSTLGQEAETGGVNRMLGVCSEFERIARAIIDKTEKENSSRRKRKSHEPPRSMNLSQPSNTPRPGSSQETPTYNNSMGSALSPKFNGEQNRINREKANSPMNMSTTNSGGEDPPRDNPPPQDDWPQDYNMPDLGSFYEMTGFGQPVQQPPLPADVGNGFQPLLPQDLWQLPMSLDWDWSETFGGDQYRSFEGVGPSV
jgi:hypothetical protein